MPRRVVYGLSYNFRGATLADAPTPQPAVGRHFQPIVPTFFFHLCNGIERIEDRTGAAAPDAATACADAAAAVREALAEGTLTVGEINGWHMEVADEAGEILAAIPFRDARTEH